MNRFILSAAVLLAFIAAANSAGQKVSPIEVKACDAGDFVSEITATGAVNCDTPPGSPSAANPTATASDMAVNGAASTYMRSDAAPAIQKATSGQFGVIEVDGTTIKATAGVISVDLAQANTWAATQTFAGVIGTVTTQAGTSYTLAAADCGTTIRFTNSSAITLTIPDNLVAGCSVAVVQADTGQVTPTVSGGAALVSHASFTKTAGQWAMIGLTIDTNAGGSSAHYILTGDGA